MRKLLFCLFVTVFFTLSLFVSCTTEIIPAQPKASDDPSDKVMLSINLSDGSSDRTAKPEINWENFIYMLEGQQGSTESAARSAIKTELFDENKTLADLSGGLALAKAYYKFTLSGYAEDIKVIEGETEPLDFTSTGQAVKFTMHPLSGKAGTAEITVIVPSSNVSKVSYCVSTNVFGTAGKFTDSAVTTENGWASSGDSASKTFEISTDCNDGTLQSGTTYFAVFKMYDKTNKCVASRIESIIIIGGLASKGTINLSFDDLRTYAPAITLMKGTENWLYSGKILVLKDTSVTPPIEYTMAESFSNGVFYGKSVPKGIYKIFIRDRSADSSVVTNEIDTGLKYSTDTEKITNASGVEKAAVKFDVANITARGVIMTPTMPMSSAVTGSSDSEIYVVEGSSEAIEFTVEIKPGYEAVPSGNGIQVHGITVFDTSGNAVTSNDRNTSKEGMQIKITAQDLLNGITTGGLQPIEYVIKYFEGIDSDNDGEDDRYEEITSSEITADQKKYTVESRPALPDATQMQKPGYDFDGWVQMVNGVPSKMSYTAIPEGTYGELDLKALWKSGTTIYDSDNFPEDDDDYEDIQSGTIKGKIFACGYSLIVKWQNNDPASNYTEIYYDYNANGEIDVGEDVLVANEDFTNFKLVAENADGTKPASDFKYTILGGKLACLEGLGKDATNTSTVNISGPGTIIGNGSTTGVLLESLTGEYVNIDEELSGNYSVTLISANEFKAGKPFYEVAYINKKSFATFDKFKCVYENEDGTFKNLTLSIKDSATDLLPDRQTVYLANPNPIYLPPKDAD